ncbi:hypothetical protein Goari_015546, partial [Gossypium aridum]|nr:hypothetical protein [Gossypium aridum]
MGKSEVDHDGIQLNETNPCSITLMPPLRLQACVTKLSK